ncbi:MAG: hypothetical protein A2654_00670 [Candidatus Nealsonbacteria bacterium RIFCSPHIGHO2_01_FULL_43_31]|uniref:Uncharacterized protein n=1 Tax=Candidatus Nealsonbacteria bacterium RIFCSPHIGHO2_01_FULL_43_31 TaxID=1801665 RepID=A0A1G2E3L1_9BACT|nr:hypothetical protein [uncultured bacterium]OGZ20444.1 MAG: hypothetical protein A2654_00670 [Candidatus Nealsonbacteria bacterium RIFCSPHIGHO2_01_FULL_43_31]OGZ24486.1 MAG: hypothetical protein A2922_02355 [Candidatus Nealsonbacteria bacterium RIFCSPLOWO2_01_FULL_43_36]
MPLPLYVRSSPAPAPKPGQGQTPSNPAPQKTSTFGYLWRKPSINQEQAKKAIVKDKPGFLERGAFRQHDSLIHEIRKNSYYKSIPTYGKKFTQAERMNLVKELEKAGRGIGGLTGEKLGLAIKSLGKEKQKALSHREFGRAKILDQKIKQAQVWRKTWDRPKI